MSDGWAVLVKVKTLSGGECKQIFYARLSDATEAVEAVKRHIHATQDVVVQAQSKITPGVFDGVKIAPGGVGQWM